MKLLDIIGHLRDPDKVGQLYDTLKLPTNSEAVLIYMKDSLNLDAELQFFEIEKTYQIQFKTSSDSISLEARNDGFYGNNKYAFCLPRSHSIENLFPDIQETAPAFFRKHKMKWHDGEDGYTSNHMCDSQVCCVNFLFSFIDQLEALALLLSPIFPEIVRMAPIEDGNFISFEWIVQENYFGEKIRKSALRTQGEYFTGADAIVSFDHKDQKRQVVLIERKYTESYNDKYIRYARANHP